MSKKQGKRPEEKDGRRRGHCVLACMPPWSQGWRKAWTKMREASLDWHYTGLFSTKSWTATVPENNYKRYYSNITHGYGGQDTAEEQNTVRSILLLLYSLDSFLFTSQLKLCGHQRLTCSACQWLLNEQINLKTGYVVNTGHLVEHWLGSITDRLQITMDHFIGLHPGKILPFCCCSWVWN